jgi:hypothetical protein
MATDETWKKRAVVFKPIMEEGVNLYKKSEEEVKTITKGYEKSEEEALKDLKKRTSYLIGVVEKASEASPKEMKKVTEYHKQLPNVQSTLRTAEENKGKAEYLKNIIEEFKDFVTGNNMFLAGSVMGKVNNKSIGQSLYVMANMSHSMADNLKDFDKREHDNRLANLANMYTVYGKKLEALGHALTGEAAPTATVKKIAKAVAIVKEHGSTS